MRTTPKSKTVSPTKKTKEPAKEAAVETSVRLTSPERLVYPDVGVTKKRRLQLLRGHCRLDAAAPGEPAAVDRALSRKAPTIRASSRNIQCRACRRPCGGCRSTTDENAAEYMFVVQRQRLLRSCSSACSRFTRGARASTSSISRTASCSISIRGRRAGSGGPRTARELRGGSRHRPRRVRQDDQRQGPARRGAGRRGRGWDDCKGFTEERRRDHRPRGPRPIRHDDHQGEADGKHFPRLPAQRPQ